MVNEDAVFKPISIKIIISASANKQLTESARAAGRSKQIEAMLRLDDSLRTIPFVDGEDWWIEKEKNNR
ncbi:MAG: TraY domain-containing protein [Hafnia sp.]|uniref:TraY domain-containing protein n=1 Tax=Hafnia sp. TaxID=1873498 RepID=UPI002FC7356F